MKDTKDKTRRKVLRPEIKKFIKILSTAFGTLIILAIAMGIAFFPSIIAAFYNDDISFAKHPAVYASGKNTFIVPYGKSDSLKLSGEDVQSVLASENGKKIYYSIKVGTEVSLYSRDTDDVDSATLVDRGIDSFIIEKDADFVLFLKDGTLYISRPNEETRKIASGVDEYSLVKNQKKVIFGKDKTYYIRGTKVSDTVEKIDDGITEIVPTDKQQKSIYYIKNSNLYRKDSGKEKIQLSDEVRSAYSTGEAVFFLKNNSGNTSTLCVVKGKKVKELLSGNIEITDMSKESEELLVTLSAPESKSLYVVKNKKLYTAVQDSKIITDAALSYDGGQVITIENNEFCVYKVGRYDIGNKKVKRTDINVITAVYQDSVLLGKTDSYGGVYDYYIYNGSKVRQMGAAKTISHANGEIYFADKEGALYRFKNGKNKLIDTNVVPETVLSLSKDRVIYLKLFDETSGSGTFCNYKNGKITVLSDDARSVLRTY